MKILNIESKITLLVVFVISVLLLFPFASSAQSGNGMYNAIPAGTLNPYSPGVFFRNGNTQYNSNNYYSAPTAQPSPEVWYSFNLQSYMDLSISVCGNLNFYFHLLDASGNELASNLNSYGCGAPFVDFSGFSPGDYYLVVEGEGYDAGSFSLSLDSYPATAAPAGSSKALAINADMLSWLGTSFSDTRSNSDPLLGDSIGEPSNDIFYKFILNESAEVGLSHCGSEIDTYMYLLYDDGSIAASNSGSGSPCSGVGYIQTVLPAGTYYMVSEGSGSNTGLIKTTIGILLPQPVISYPAKSVSLAVGSPAILPVTDMSGTPSYIQGYSVSPSLPAGLHLNTTTGTISGTPTTVSVATNYTITANNAIASTTAILNIAVLAEPVQPSKNKNYIRTTTFREPFTVVPPALSISDAMVEMVYFDGLGRPIQQVQVKGSPGGFKDIVVPIVYDAYGRQDKNYLPYATGTGSGGEFKESAISAQGNFYNSPPLGVVQIPQAGGVTPSFAQTVFESSPLNRVLEQGAPGAAWQPAATRGTTGRTVLSEQATNNQTDFNSLSGTRQVALYGVSLSSTGIPVLTLNGAYGTGQLYMNIIKDENWTDQQANLRAGTVEEYTDKQGRVILKRAFNQKDNALEMLSTYYVYDVLGNLSFVLPPGINPDRSDLPTATELDNFAYRYRYDGRNRLVEKQLPGKGVEFLVYNELDQPILTQDSIQRTSNQWLFSKYDALGRPVMSGVATLTGSRTQVQVAAVVDSVLWETPDSTNTETGYRNATATYPFAGNIDNYLTINYYDNYSFPEAATVTAEGSYSNMTRSLPTGSRVYTVDGTVYYLSASYYDDKGRVAETVSLNHVDGMDRIVNTYNFPGELETSVRTHMGYSQASEIGTKYTYDHMGRKLKTVQYIDNPADTVVLSQLAYNEIGQLIEKKIHSRNDGPFLNTESYRYNPRGWLKNQSSPRFAMELKYEDGTDPQYNGNISNQYWGTGVNPTLHNYSYLYDKLNRLTSGISDEGFNELISYDKMGNITSLNRNPMGTNTYSYSGNRLASISGAINGSYTYDANGNQISDSHKGITLAYNYLNLPETISKASTWETMTNTWLATGAKITKLVDDMTREYVGGIEYNSGMIEFIQTEEGRAIMTSNATYSYEYMLKDHLGNTRVLLEEDGTVLETSDYYPFGLQVARGQTVISPENRYKYNGKELQTELGLGQYDYGARFYDPVIGRWNVIDPLAEKFYPSTPYNYVDNNPIIKIDPNGMSPWTHIDKHGNILPLDDEGYLDVHATTEKEIQELLNQLPLDYSMSDSDQEDPKKKSKQSEDNVDKEANQGVSWDNSKYALGIGGAFYGAMETAVRPGDQWLGKNGKYYKNSWGGNQYTGSRSGAFKAASRYKLAGGAIVAVTAVIGGIETYSGYQKDGDQFGYNAQSAAAQTVGGIGGGVGGTVLGAKVGAGIGVWFGGFGAIPGAVIGGFVGGFVGGSWGSSAGQGVINIYHGK